MYKTKIDNLDLKQIADSGQCFRWKNTGENEYTVVAFDRALRIKQDGNEFELDCDEADWNNIWKSYLDMDTDYAGIAKLTNSVDLLCRRCGHKIDGSAEGEELYTFPKPLEVPDEVFDDRSMGFGYRAPYLKEIYEYGANYPDWLDNLRKMSYDEAMENLLTRKGIGKKVANCICLFGLHHVDAFPIDTHVKQLLDKYYSDGFDFERYKGVAGIIQQYLFYFEL